MKHLLITPRLPVLAFLFAAAVLSFPLIKKCGYFEPTAAAPHIIDSHLQPDGTDSSFAQYSQRFFDHAYVKEAAKHYSPRKYMNSYYLLDFFFPLIYGGFFIALTNYWKGSTFYRTFRSLMIVTMLLDLSENTSFAWYLFHQEGNTQVLVAIFTTLKSVLFISGMLTAVFAFGAACVSRLKNR